MSTTQITETNFDAATVIPQSLYPKAPGMPESQFVSGLTPGDTYWFAIKVGDEVFNWSPATIIQVSTAAGYDHPGSRCGSGCNGCRRLQRRSDLDRHR